MGAFAKKSKGLSSTTTSSANAKDMEVVARLPGTSPLKAPSEVYPGLPPFIGATDEEARKRVDLMLRNAPCGLIVTTCSTRECPILYVNKIFEFMTGYSAAEILGRDCRFLQFRGPYASSAHKLVDQSVVRAIRDALTERREWRTATSRCERRTCHQPTTSTHARQRTWQLCLRWWGGGAQPRVTSGAP